MTRHGRFTIICDHLRHLQVCRRFTIEFTTDRKPTCDFFRG